MVLSGLLLFYVLSILCLFLNNFNKNIHQIKSLILLIKFEGLTYCTYGSYFQATYLTPSKYNLANYFQSI